MPVDLAMLLKEMSPDDGIGHVLEFDNKRVVIVDNSLPSEVYLAPAELIAVDF